MRHLIPAQLEVISATQAEEREFNELRRDLPRATSLAGAVDALFRHLRRVVPAAGLAFYAQKSDGADLSVEAAAGATAGILQGVVVPVGERISGWAFAHRQVVLNSDAALELGPVARTLPIPLRYAAAVPVVVGGVSGVVTAYSTDPFTTDHRRMLEGAVTLLASSVSVSGGQELQPAKSEGPSVRESSKNRVH